MPFCVSSTVIGAAYLVMDQTNTVLDIIELSPVGESEVKLKEENLVN